MSITFPGLWRLVVRYKSIGASEEFTASSVTVKVNQGSNHEEVNSRDCYVYINSLIVFAKSFFPWDLF
jgi:hypothetical protein